MAVWQSSEKELTKTDALPACFSLALLPVILSHSPARAIQEQKGEVRGVHLTKSL